MVICQHCDAVVRCPACENYICPSCGADLTENTQNNNNKPSRMASSGKDGDTNANAKR